MSDLRPSVRATYDSTETGPRYWVTTEVDGETVQFREPVPDPFVRKTVHVTWQRWSWLPWPRRQVTVTVVVGADPELMNDVLELDENTLIPGRTRQAAFRQSMHGKLRAFGDELP